MPSKKPDAKPPALSEPGVEPQYKDAAEITSALERDLGAKRDTFKGRMLAPYNRTYHNLALAASKPVDPPNFFAFLLVYILIRGEEIYQEGLTKLSGNVEAAEDAVDARLPLEIEDDTETFRAAVRKWSRRFVDADAELASDIIIAARERVERAAVEVTTSGGNEESGKSRPRLQP